MDTFVRSASRATDAGARSTTESKALLSQCRELARSKLSRIVAEALDKIENDLFSLAEGSTSRAEQQILFEAMAHVKRYRTDIARAFDAHFITIFEQRISSRRGGASSARAEPTLGELSLVDDTALEEDLVVSDLARRTRNRIDPDELLGIRARFGHLLSQELLEDETNPLSPEAVFEALKLACAKIPGDFAVKRSLLNAFQPYVEAGIGTLYADVNQNLIAHHVLPRIKHSVKRQTDGLGGHSYNAALAASQAVNLSHVWNGGSGQPAITPGQALNIGQLLASVGTAPTVDAEAAPQPVPHGMGSPIDLSALLSGMRNGPPTARAQVTRMLVDPSRYAMESALSTPASPALMTSLSALQSTPGSGHDFVAQIGEQVQAQSHPLDQVTIELVTMVFDYILDDPDVPDAVKGEIARLQIVAVKAAILDRSFFARRQHPMRQLLDRIGEVASDPEVATDEHSKLTLGLRGIVDNIIHNFTDDLAVFTVALETLEKIVEELRATRQTEISATTVELTRKEEADIAHVTALAEVQRRVTRRTPSFVRDFLYNWWTKTLVDACLREREGDNSWTDRLGVVDSLVWSVSPLKTAEIQQLAAMLPLLMRNLLRGMNAIEMPPDARHAFFNQLMQAHTASISAAKAQTKPAGDVSAAEAAAAPAEPAEPAAAPDEPEEPTPDANAATDYYVHTVMALERGAIVEFLEGEKAVRAKLSWVSPKQTILLFTSSLAGARQLAPKVLADLFRDGRARVLEASEALMDRVVEAMMTPAATNQ